MFQIVFNTIESSILKDLSTLAVGIATLNSTSKCNTLPKDLCRG